MDKHPNRHPVVDIPAPEFLVVKVGEIDLNDPEVVGCTFAGKEDDSKQYLISDIDRTDEVPEGYVDANLTLSDFDPEEPSVTHRVRVSHHLREARTLTWANLDEKQTMRTIAKVAGAVAIGVMTLYKIRKKRSHE